MALTFRFNLMRALFNSGSYYLRYSSNDSHIVQMRGLDFDTTEEDIIQFFKPLGITPKKINLNRDGSGRTAAFSEVEFSSHAEAVVALRKKNAFIGHRFIRLTLRSSDSAGEAMKTDDKSAGESFSDEASNIDERLKSVESPQTHTGHVIRMENMPLRTTDQDIYDFFWPVGAKAISVQPVYNENGFRTGEFDVQFLTSDEVEKAVVKNAAYFLDRAIVLATRKCRTEDLIIPSLGEPSSPFVLVPEF